MSLFFSNLLSDNPLSVIDDFIESNEYYIRQILEYSKKIIESNPININDLNITSLQLDNDITIYFKKINAFFFILKLCNKNGDDITNLDIPIRIHNTSNDFDTLHINQTYILHNYSNYCIYYNDKLYYKIFFLNNPNVFYNVDDNDFEILLR